MQRIITYLGNINLRSEYIYFLIAASVFIIILLFLARLVKLYFPTFSYGLIVMCLWALIVTYAFSLDFLKVSPLAYYLSLILILLSFITYSKLKKNFNWKEILIGKDSKYLLKLFITWCLGMAIMLAPMILVFAKALKKHWLPGVMIKY